MTKSRSPRKTRQKPKKSHAPKHVFHRLGELFCGPGGIGYGAQQVNVSSSNGDTFSIKHVWANDYDPDSCKTYRKNILIDPSMVKCEPVDRFVQRFKDLPKIDALTFGFPCNDFSNVGERKGLAGSFGPLYEYGAKALDYFNPKWFLAENVGGLSNSNAGETFLKIIRRLQTAGKHGYDLTIHLYRFEEYGVPQARHRIVIAGTRRKLRRTFNVPAPTHPNRAQWVSAKSVLEREPAASTWSNSEKTKQSPTVQARLALIKPGQNVWNADLPEELQLKVKGARLSQIYRRLDLTSPAYTITGSGGGGTHVYHFKDNRALTNRERARLQTFPDTFHFEGTKEKVRKQIGMAVPPAAAQLIVEAMLKTFAGVAYEFVEPKWEIPREDE